MEFGSQTVHFGKLGILEFVILQKLVLDARINGNIPNDNI